MEDYISLIIQLASFLIYSFFHYLGLPWLQEKMKLKSRFVMLKDLEEVKLANAKGIEDLKNKFVELLRDEPIRTSLESHISTKKFEITIEIYQEVYALFFKILYLKRSDKNKNKLISDELLKVREKIFMNSVYLGELTEIILHAQIGLEDKLECKTGHKKEENLNYDPSKELTKAENWISEEFQTEKTLRSYNPVELQKLRDKLDSDEQESKATPNDE